MLAKCSEQFYDRIFCQVSRTFTMLQFIFHKSNLRQLEATSTVKKRRRMPRYAYAALRWRIKHSICLAWLLCKWLVTSSLSPFLKVTYHTARISKQNREQFEHFVTDQAHYRPSVSIETGTDDGSDEIAVARRVFWFTQNERGTGQVLGF